ncbi:hypothetical protein H0H87_006528, partial [Tephrocybe sp. NHM501043]
MAPLVQAMTIGNDMELEYEALERTEPVQVNGKPHHWDANKFSEQLYNDFCQAFEDVLSYIDKEHGG